MNLLVRFELAQRQFGIRLEQVRELLPMASLTPVPAAPVLEGLLNLRGQAVPVFDLRGALGLPAKEPEPADRLIVANVDQKLLALRADHVHDLVPWHASDQDAGELWPGLGRHFSVARVDDRFLFIPDLAGLWSAHEIAVLSQVAGRATQGEGRLAAP